MGALSLVSQTFAPFAVLICRTAASAVSAQYILFSSSLTQQWYVSPSVAVVPSIELQIPANDEPVFDASVSNFDTLSSREAISEIWNWISFLEHEFQIFISTLLIPEKIK